MRKNGKSVGFTLDPELDTAGLVIKALNGRFEHENLRNPRYDNILGHPLYLHYIS